jgi:hypothetical protein
VTAECRLAEWEQDGMAALSSVLGVTAVLPALNWIFSRRVKKLENGTQLGVVIRQRVPPGLKLAASRGIARRAEVRARVFRWRTDEAGFRGKREAS